MPELPEVEVVRRGLADHVVVRTIAHVDVAHPRAVRRHVEGDDDFAARLVGHTITAAGRRGKYLWLELDGCDRSGHDASAPHSVRGGRPAPDPRRSAIGERERGRAGRASATGMPAPARAAASHSAGVTPARVRAGEPRSPCAAKTAPSTVTPSTTASSRTVVDTPEAAPCSSRLASS